MTDVTVVRGLGAQPGDDIQDILLAADQAAVSRGTSVIDENTPAARITLTCRYREDVNIGDLVEVVDPDQGPVYRAQVLGKAMRMSSPVNLLMTLQLWRPL